jgi:hypothetical protein
MVSSWQFASRLPAEKPSRTHTPGIQPDLLVEHAYNPIPENALRRFYEERRKICSCNI